MLLDKESEERAKLLAPEANIFNLHSLEQPADAIELPKPVAGSIANWLDKEEPSVDKAILERMKALSV